jgi:hypothetical protein
MQKADGKWQEEEGKKVCFISFLTFLQTEAGYKPTPLFQTLF